VLALEPAPDLGCKLGRCQYASKEVFAPQLGFGESGPPSSSVFAAIAPFRLPRALEPVQLVVRDNLQQALRVRRNSLHRLRKVGTWPPECWSYRRASVRVHALVEGSDQRPVVIISSVQARVPVRLSRRGVP
jgi:hypothetical protein